LHEKAERAAFLGQPFLLYWFIVLSLSP
jgi:hypothetical protein